MKNTKPNQTQRRSEKSPTGDKGKRTIPRNPEDRKLAEIVKDVKVIWPQIDEETKTYINRTILAKLRTLDYVARQKLLLLQTGLRIEQSDTRPDLKEFEDLHELVPLIDDIEQTIADEDFDQELTTAVFNLPQDEQEKLLKKLEAEQETETAEQ